MKLRVPEGEQLCRGARPRPVPAGSRGRASSRRGRGPGARITSKTGVRERCHEQVASERTGHRGGREPDAGDEES